MKVRRATLTDLDHLIAFTAAEAHESEQIEKAPTTLSEGIKRALEDESIALYWVLFESVELRQAPFFFWIQDLAVMDPFFILPLLMGASMYYMQSLNPQVGDPMQVKMMKMMPIMFTVLFLFFPAGLVLYWVVNNVLGIAQQWWGIKQTEAAAA